MASDESTANPEDAATPPRDASLRVDPRNLPSEEQAFAKLMGFGDEGNAPAPVSADPAGAPASPARPVVSLEAPTTPTTSIEVGEPILAPERTIPVAEPIAAADAQAADESPVASEEVVDLPVREWDEIHPRAAKLGRQSRLLEQVDRILALEEIAVPSVAASEEALAAGCPAPPDATRKRAADAATDASTQDAIRALEKALDLTRSELDSALLERDRLDDALAIANAARSESALRVERLETALRAARGPGGVLPEGESALRAEVQGLRRRLEDAQGEVRTLRESLANHATDLAIALAHRDDRQQELDQRREELERLEREHAVQNERLDDALIRQRELLALVSRVQAENVELRSTQSALEETLEARDLEIEAREEHLQVTRRGLSARDAQLRDAEGRLEQERHRRELVEAELERARQQAAALEERVMRREARIAALSSTLTRVEEAIGHPVRSIPTHDPAPTTTRKAAEACADADSPAPPTLPGSAMPPESVPSRSIPLVAAARPEVLRRWRDAQIRALADNASISSLAEWFAQNLAGRAAATAIGSAVEAKSDQAAPDAARALRLISLVGSGATTEIGLVRALEARGCRRPTMLLLAASSEQASRLRAEIEAAGLPGAIDVEVFGGRLPADEPADAVLLCDTLWDQPDPDALLGQIAAALTEDGCLLFADRLASGPLTLSEATCAKLAELWQVLPESWTAHPGFAQAPEAGDDAGVPVRELDLASLIASRFISVTALGLGHIADLFLGPTRSPAFREADPIGASLLDSIRAIDEGRALQESLPPRHGLAVLRRRATATDARAEDAQATAIVWSTRSSG